MKQDKTPARSKEIKIVFHVFLLARFKTMQKMPEKETINDPTSILKVFVLVHVTTSVI